MYAYARHEFGDFAGYLTAWCYWITCWAGNAAIVASWVLYVESLFGIDNPSNWTNFGIALTGLWIPAAINLAGVRQMAWFQNLTVVLKFLPLLLVGTLGWFFVEQRELRTVQRVGRKPVRRHRHRGRCGAVLLHRSRVRVDRRRSGQEPAPQRRPGLGVRHRRQRAAVRRGDRRGHGARAARQARRRRRPVRRRLQGDVRQTPDGSASSSPSSR